MKKFALCLFCLAVLFSLGSFNAYTQLNNDSLRLRKLEIAVDSLTVQLAIKEEANKGFSERLATTENLWIAVIPSIIGLMALIGLAIYINSYGVARKLATKELAEMKEQFNELKTYGDQIIEELESTSEVLTDLTKKPPK